MADNYNKGLLLENIVASFHNNKNLKVEKRKIIKKREIDILLTISHPEFENITIPIECKNQKKKLE